MLGDLKSPKLIVLKAALFLVIGFLSAALLLIGQPTIQNLALLILAVWGFCRAYYFAFYVITNYIDKEYKYSGLFSAIRHILSSRSK